MICSPLRQQFEINSPAVVFNTRKRRTLARFSRLSPWINKKRGTRLCRGPYGYYPSFTTLSRFARSLVSLHILNNRIQPAIFEDIAQEAINICRLSLVSAAEMIKGVKTNVISQGPGSSYATSKTLDGELFLVRHLLILKEMTQNLDLVGRDDTSRTIDLSSVTGTFYTCQGLCLM